jgi:hypothetical protein
MPTGKIIAKRWNATSFTWFEWVCQDLFSRMSALTDTRIVLIFAQVTFLGLSYITYPTVIREERHKKCRKRKGSTYGHILSRTIGQSCVHVRVLKAVMCFNKRFVSEITRNATKYLHSWGGDEIIFTENSRWHEVHENVK